MDWKRKFKNIILERGRYYYTHNYVQNLTYDDHIYRARVLGDYAYAVEIKIRNNDIIYMKCSCPHAAKGNYCKHMAAVMFAIEKKGDSLKQLQLDFRESWVHPFESAVDTYQFFDMGRIAGDFEVPERLLVDAKQLIEEKRVLLDSVSIDFQPFMRSDEMAGYVRGHVADPKGDRQMTLIFDRDNLLRAECGVPGCGGRYDSSYYANSSKKICIHLLALMLLVDAYLKKYNPGDATNREGRMLLNQFRGQHAREVLGQQAGQLHDFSVEPVLEKTYNGLYLTLKAGVEKLYVVKDLTELVRLYDGRKIITLGTKTEVDLSRHRISQVSESLFEYVRQIVREEQSRVEHTREVRGYYYTEEEIKGRILLFGERIDRLYDLCEGKSVACNDKSNGRTEKSVLTFCAGKPKIQIQVEKDVDSEQVFHGVHVTGSVPDFVRGSKYRYYFTSDKFCRIGEETAQEIMPLLESGAHGDISFKVGRKYLAEFYHEILPVLRRSVEVEEPEYEHIQEYIPPEATFVFYLDAENGNVSCRPQAHYGERKVSLLDNLREDHGYEWFRSDNREEEILYHVQQLFPVIDLEKDEMRCEDSEEAVLRLLDGGVDRLMALGEVHTTDRFRNISVRKKPKLKVGVSIESDIMNLSITSEDISQEELLQILQSYQRKKKYYRLKNGDLITVSQTDMEMLQQMMETMQISPKEFVKGNMQIPIYRALYLNKMLEQSENVYLNRDRRFKNLVKEFKTVEDSEFEVPSSLMPIMRGYQVHGFKWLKTLEQYGFGGILADDMGLGKTLQAISLLLDAKQKGGTGTALIVSPASLVYNWGEEFIKFAPDLKVTLVVGNQQERKELIKNYQDSDVLVTSYDLLKRDVVEYEEAQFAYQILDEAQYIKNHGTAAAKSVKVIKCRHRFALTGTPIENRLSELWSIFDYLMPGYLYGYETFRKNLETPIVKYKEEQASQRLKKMVSPFILRRLKEDVLADLPDKLEEIRYAKLETQQQQLYDGQVVHMKDMISSQQEEDFQKNKLQILAELTKIRQICCDPELLFEKYDGGSAKRIACLELIQSAMEGGHKMLVFSQFTSMLELLERDLAREGISYYKITGSTPKQQRVELVNTFNGDDTPVFLISLKAGGTGLNLTGADVVIHYDPWWNQAVQNQATDRAHRIGQTKAVSVYKLIAKGTIEEKIVKMQEDKRDLADAVLSGENGSITQMSKEDLLALLGTKA